MIISWNTLSLGIALPGDRQVMLDDSNKIRSYDLIRVDRQSEDCLNCDHDIMFDVSLSFDAISSLRLQYLHH